MMLNTLSIFLGNLSRYTNSNKKITHNTMPVFTALGQILSGFSQEYGSIRLTFDKLGTLQTLND